MGGQDGQLPTQIWVGQLTLTRGADCAPTILLAHPALGSFLRPCSSFGSNKLFSWTQSKPLLIQSDCVTGYFL